MKGLGNLSSRMPAIARALHPRLFGPGKLDSRNIEPVSAFLRNAYQYVQGHSVLARIMYFFCSKMNHKEKQQLWMRNELFWLDFEKSMQAPSKKAVWNWTIKLLLLQLLPLQLLLRASFFFCCCCFLCTDYSSPALRKPKHPAGRGKWCPNIGARKEDYLRDPWKSLEQTR